METADCLEMLLGIVRVHTKLSHARPRQKPKTSNWRREGDSNPRYGF